MPRETRGDGKQNSSELANEDFIKKVCDNVSLQLKSKISGIENKLNKLDKLDEMDSKLTSLNESIKALSVTVNSNEKSIRELKLKHDSSEQFVKKSSLRFYGLYENADEDIIELVCGFISTTLNVPCTPQDIDAAFRIGKSNNNDKPRAVLVSFVNNWKRSLVFGAKKLLKKSNVSIFEDLTKIRYETLLSAKSKYGKDRVWSSGGNVFALLDGKKSRVNAGDLL